MASDSHACSSCSTPLPDGAAFCPTCGTPTRGGASLAARPSPLTDRRVEDIEALKAALADRYTVERELGRGGMATVYLAQDRKHGRRVAIKVLHADVASVVGAERFLREIEITARLQHPNILPVHDSGEAGGFLYYVMPHVEGESLRDLLSRRGKLLLDEALQLTRDVASALSYAHARDVVHRDIKPENILLTAGRAQVADFGIARALSAAGTDTLTQTGAIVGTPAYMAPEQAGGAHDVDGRADLYALAAVACELLTGDRTDTLADRGTNEEKLLIARPDLRPALRRALVAPLALDRAERPDSVEEWLAQLKAAEHPVRSVTTRMGIAAAAVFLLLFVTWLVVGRGDATPPAPPAIAVLPFTIVGPAGEVDLAALLPQAFDGQLNWLPEHRVVSAGRVRAAIAAEFGGMAADVDTLTAFIAGELGATEILSGRAQVGPDGSIVLDVQVRDAASRRVVRTARAAGPLDSLPALVSDIVLQAFAEHVARERAGWSPALPKGVEAFNAYYRAEASFRRGAYDDAIRQFDDVIQRDTTFAPAYFKRMLAEILRAQPTRASQAVRSALEAVRAHRDSLDPTTRELLAGYDGLITNGDLEGALEAFQHIVQRNPDALDAWFVLGYLQLNFGPLLGIPRTGSRLAFERAYALDPGFAAGIAHLARIAIQQENEPATRRYVREYLALDSISTTAEILRIIDSLLYAGTRGGLRVTASLPERPAFVLELLALAAGEFGRRRRDREVGELAIRTLWERAATRTDRSVAFRLRMACHLGTGRLASADSLLRQARRRDVPQGDLDRWIVLTAVTGVAQLGDETARADAAARLLDAHDDAQALWLAARWYRARDRRRAERAAGALRDLVERRASPTPLELSLRDDLEAREHLERGDTATALATWRRATQRYSVDEVTFGLAGSLWPLHLERARLAAAMGDDDGVLSATKSFEAMAGFVDQVAWPEIWLLRGDALRRVGDALAAREAFDKLAQQLRDANGEGTAARDAAAARLLDRP